MITFPVRFSGGSNSVLKPSESTQTDTSAPKPKSHLFILPHTLDVANVTSLIIDLQKTAKEMLASGQQKPTIRFSLDCVGGNEVACRSLIQTMKDLKARGITIEVYAGTAYSAAALIFANGSPGHRFISPSGDVIVHEPRVHLTTQKDYNLPKYQFEFAQMSDKLALQNKQQQQNLIEQSQGKLNKTLLEEKTKNGENWLMTPEDAVKYGIADEIKSLPIEG